VYYHNLKANSEKDINEIEKVIKITQVTKSKYDTKQA
jgi:hypothetical protein